jgi:hypothetical protein
MVGSNNWFVPHKLCGAKLRNIFDIYKFWKKIILKIALRADNIKNTENALRLRKQTKTIKTPLREIDEIAAGAA